MEYVSHNREDKTVKIKISRDENHELGLATVNLWGIFRPEDQKDFPGVDKDRMDWLNHRLISLLANPAKSSVIEMSLQEVQDALAAVSAVRERFFAEDPTIFLGLDEARLDHLRESLLGVLEQTR